MLSLLVVLIGSIELKPRLAGIIAIDPFVKAKLENKSIFKNVNPLVLFVTLFAYSIQVSLLALLIAQFFNKRKV